MKFSWTTRSVPELTDLSYTTFHKHEHVFKETHNSYRWGGGGSWKELHSNKYILDIQSIFTGSEDLLWSPRETTFAVTSIIDYRYAFTSLGDNSMLSFIVFQWNRDEIIYRDIMIHINLCSCSVIAVPFLLTVSCFIIGCFYVASNLTRVTSILICTIYAQILIIEKNMLSVPQGWTPEETQMLQTWR